MKTMDEQPLSKTAKTLCKMFILGECELNFGIRLEMETLALPYHPPMCKPFEAATRELINTTTVRELKNIFSDKMERGLYKMVVDGATDRVIGLHMIGPESGEIIQAAAVAIKAGLTKADFDATVAIHPTMAEELVLLK